MQNMPAIKQSSRSFFARFLERNGHDSSSPFLDGVRQHGGKRAFELYHIHLKEMIGKTLKIAPDSAMDEGRD